MVAALTATLGLATASWAIAVRQMEGMDMGVATELGWVGSEGGSSLTCGALDQPLSGQKHKRQAGGHEQESDYRVQDVLLGLPVLPRADAARPRPPGRRLRR